MDTKINFLSVDGKTAISSYGEYFRVDEIVSHQDESVGTAKINEFVISIKDNEVKVLTDKGYCRLDFLVKIKNKLVDEYDKD